MDVALPILPCADPERTAAFYERLGFVVTARHPAPYHYVILRLGDLELHFTRVDGLDPAQSVAACYLRVADADALHARFSDAGLPAQGIPRLGPIENKPWGMREFHLIDPDGTLLRAGHSART